MSDIRRYSEEQIVDGYVAQAAVGINPSLGTEPIFVAYADHVEALRQAEQRGFGATRRDVYDRAYEQGQRDALDRCITAAVNNSGRSVAHVIAALREIRDAAIKGDNDE